MKVLASLFPHALEPASIPPMELAQALQNVVNERERLLEEKRGLEGETTSAEGVTTRTSKGSKRTHTPSPSTPLFPQEILQEISRHAELPRVKRALAATSKNMSALALEEFKKEKTLTTLQLFDFFEIAWPTELERLKELRLTFEKSMSETTTPLDAKKCLENQMVAFADILAKMLAQGESPAEQSPARRDALMEPAKELLDDVDIMAVASFTAKRLSEHINIGSYAKNLLSQITELHSSNSTSFFVPILLDRLKKSDFNRPCRISRILSCF